MRDARLPEASQLSRVRLQRIWHSSFGMGSFGRGMFTSYDYEVTRFLSGGQVYIQLTDPGFIGSGSGGKETFRSEAGVFIPFQWSGRQYLHTKIVEATDTHITFLQLSGVKLRFEWTGYLQSGSISRARLEYIEDRNGNRVNFVYQLPASTTTPDVFMWKTVTDPYGRALQFSYILWQGMNVISEVILPDGRNVKYTYDAAKNPIFMHKVDYGNGIVSTLTYDQAAKIVGRNEALLEADHYKQSIQLSEISNGAGRTRNIKRADGSFLYARKDSLEGDVYVTLLYHSGKTFEIKRNTTKVLTSHRQMRVDGTWEELTTYDAPDFRPITGITKPGPMPRKWSSERDDSNDEITSQTYPDGSSESFTFNEFAQMTSHTKRNGEIDTWSYDGAGNLLSRTEAAGVDGVEATERWTYNARGQVLTHSDFNGNVSSFSYYANGELATIALPAGIGQPAGTITYTYDGAGRIRSITDPVNRVVAYSYDSAGRLIKTTYGDGSTEVVDYDTGEFSARVLSRKDRNGNTTLYTYDATGRVLTMQVQEAGTGKILSTTTNTWDGPTGRPWPSMLTGTLPNTAMIITVGC